jgi:hypothetical protein
MYYIYLNKKHQLMLCFINIQRNNNSIKPIIIDSVNVKELLKYKQKVVSCIFHQHSSNLYFVAIKAEITYCLVVHILIDTKSLLSSPLNSNNLLNTNNIKLNLFELDPNFKKMTSVSPETLVYDILEEKHKNSQCEIIRKSLNNYEFNITTHENFESASSFSFQLENKDIIKIHSRASFDESPYKSIYVINLLRNYKQILYDTFETEYFTKIIYNIENNSNNFILAYAENNTVHILKLSSDKIDKIDIPYKYNTINLLSIDSEKINYSIGKKVYEFYYVRNNNITKKKSKSIPITDIHKNSNMVFMNLKLYEVYLKVLNTKFNSNISNLILDYIL